MLNISTHWLSHFKDNAVSFIVALFFFFSLSFCSRLLLAGRFVHTALWFVSASFARASERFFLFQSCCCKTCFAPKRLGPYDRLNETHVCACVVSDSHFAPLSDQLHLHECLRWQRWHPTASVAAFCFFFFFVFAVLFLFGQWRNSQWMNGVALPFHTKKIPVQKGSLIPTFCLWTRWYQPYFVAVLSSLCVCPVFSHACFAVRLVKMTPFFFKVLIVPTLPRTCLLARSRHQVVLRSPSSSHPSNRAQKRDTYSVYPPLCPPFSPHLPYHHPTLPFSLLTPSVFSGFSQDLSHVSISTASWVTLVSTFRFFFYFARPDLD